MDCLLTNDLYIARPVNEKYLVDFLIHIGYEDAPKENEKGKVLSNRVTPIHVLGQRDQMFGRRNIQNITNIPKLFKVYNRFDVNYTDEVGFTHFHAACMYGCYYTVQKFLNHGHDPNCIERGTSFTPLHYSVTYENPEVTELLLSRGANPNLADADGSTPLHIICSSSIFDEKSAKMLFQMSDRRFQPVQVDARDKFGETPLHKAYRHRNKHAIEFLLRHDADPNASNTDRSTPLHVCCTGDRVNYDLVNILFMYSNEKYHPVQINARDIVGDTPLITALVHHQKKAVKLLLRRGANPNLANNRGRTPLHYICENFHGGTNMAKLFFEIIDDKEHLVKIDAEDQWGYTPLKAAVATLNPDLIDILFKRGANLSNFAFPEEKYFVNGFGDFKLMLTCRALMVVARLAEQEYELEQSDVLTIMKFFAKNQLFQNSADLKKCWYDGVEFVETARAIEVTPSLSLYDLIKTPHKQAEKLVSYSDYFKLTSLKNLSQACTMHLCEMMARGFFHRWATYPFWNLIHKRLPLECCDMIIEQLSNEDSYNICLAHENQRK
uniref:Uncharacterized protein n=1 Tax=Trichogramma kaykai TaxID=54128 RepID=A0ABD2XCS0_9HYME